MANRVIKACDNNVHGKSIAILGLAFKPNTDDMRDSPSLDIIQLLQQKGANIKVYDPEAMEESRKLLTKIEYSEDAYSCVKGADALVIVTEWDQFRALDLTRIKQDMNTPIIVDLRNIYNVDEMKKLGFQYSSIGRI